MKILGIDPGTGRLGYGVIEKTGFDLKLVDYGTIETDAHTPLSDRLVNIEKRLEEVVRIFKPDQMAVESIFFFRNAKTAMGVAHARGVVLLVGAKNNLELSEFTPMEIKMTLTGYGRAEKKQIHEEVLKLLGHSDPIRPDDSADALAVALTRAVTLRRAAKQTTK